MAAPEPVGFLPWGPGDPEPSNADAFADDIAVGDSVVEFWSARCNACRRLAPWLAERVRETGGAVRAFTVDVDREIDAALVAKVTVAPTLICYRDGVERTRWEGAFHLVALEAWWRAAFGAGATVSKD